MKSKMIRFEDIVLFLNYPDEFWEYIKPRIRRVEPLDEKNRFFYKTLLKFDKDDNLIDIKVIVPRIVDIDTACVNIHELKHAYDMYLLLNNPVNEKEPKYEEDARNLEKEFKLKILKIK